jgi:hypothetical protein
MVLSTQPFAVPAATPLAAGYRRGPDRDGRARDVQPLSSVPVDTPALSHRRLRALRPGRPGSPEPKESRQIVAILAC